MTMEIRKAERKKAKLRLGIAAPSGAGKTYGALQLAFGIGGKVGMIDTEHGSGDLYAHLGDYDIISIEAPYTTKKYLDAIEAFESAKYNTIIIDSLSHAWAGDGGLLDKQGKIAAASRSGNSYTAWREVTPDHNQLVDAMLRSRCHIIATMRSKQDYVQDKDEKGKTTIRKVGLAPVQREGMEYEFTVMIDVNTDHTATASKDRTGMFDGEFFKLDKKTGKKILEWLESGVEPHPSIFKDENERLDFSNGIIDGIAEQKTEEALKSVFEKSKETIEKLGKSTNEDDIAALSIIRTAYGRKLTDIKAAARALLDEKAKQIMEKAVEQAPANDASPLVDDFIPDFGGEHVA